eukprot:2188559-Pleurochrysis_carterae.AAC.4
MMRAAVGGRQWLYRGSEDSPVLPASQRVEICIEHVLVCGPALGLEGARPSRRNGDREQRGVRLGVEVPLADEKEARVEVLRVALLFQARVAPLGCSKVGAVQNACGRQQVWDGSQYQHIRRVEGDDRVAVDQREELQTSVESSGSLFREGVSRRRAVCKAYQRPLKRRLGTNVRLQEDGEGVLLTQCVTRLLKQTAALSTIVSKLHDHHGHTDIWVELEQTIHEGLMSDHKLAVGAVGEA